MFACRYMHVHTWYIRIICNVHVRVIEAENSLLLYIYHYNVFTARKWRSEMIMGFVYECTCQDREYIIEL